MILFIDINLISFCNVITKILTKIFANQFKLVLSIIYNQISFIIKKQVTNNIVIGRKLSIL